MQKTLLRLGKIVFIPSLIVYSTIIGLSKLAGIQQVLVLRDLLQSCDYPIGVGMISNIGILLWTTAAAISLFASLSGLVRTQHFRQFLLLGGLLSSFLCLDDFFLLHDRYIGPDFLYISYSIFAIIILIRFRNLILSIDIGFFLTAISLLGLSILTDKVQFFLPFGYNEVQLFEEGFKFIGIACWVAFWWHASLIGLSLRTKT